MNLDEDKFLKEINRLDLMEKLLNIAHWTFTAMFLIPLFLGALLAKVIDASILIGIMVLGYCGMWICSALGGGAVGDDYDNYGDG